MEKASSITCPDCGKTSYNTHDISARFCGSCGFHADLKESIKETGGKAELLEYIKNPKGLPEPLMFNFGGFSQKRILEQLAPFWLDHVTRNKALTPLENAKKNCHYTLTIMPMDDCVIDESISFCYTEDEPSKAQFGVALNGGLVVLYDYDIVWFKEPDGSECWARMD